MTLLSKEISLMMICRKTCREEVDIVENADEKVSLVDNEVNEVEEGDGSVLYKPLINDDLDSRDVHCENGMIDEMLESERVSSMRRAEESQHLLADEVGDRNVELGDGKLTSYIDDVPRGNELDSSLVSSWKCVTGDEDAGDGDKDDDDNDDDDESSDSGSDGAESSSPDASLADISLMLDELHPLLGSEAIQAAQLSRDGLDSVSESSHGSSDDESDESENKGEGENNEEEGGAKGDNEDESKSAIKWTEDDQKNLMDLGNLEVKETYDWISLLQGEELVKPRRNPFDLPYDSSEEKPDLKGDSFQEFSGVPRQELKWKPYFVPEQLVTEGASPSLFQRQSSEVSESKLSSIPDSESVSSVVDEEDNKPNKQDVSRETELILNEDHVSVDEQESHSSDSDDVESVDVDQVENRDVHHDVVEITLGDGESHLEIEPVSEAGATNHSEHTASEAENRDVHHDTVVITLGDVARATLNATEIHPRTEPVEEDYSSRSSLSSLSEIDEKISDVKGVGSAVETFLSFSTVSSDKQAEISEMDSPSMLVESIDEKHEAHGEMAEQEARSSSDEGEVVDSSPEEQQHQRHPNESSEANIREEHEKESEMDQTQAPFSDSKTNTGCDEGVLSNSSHQDMSSRESPSSESEKQLLFDKHELPVDEHDKLEEPSIIATESTRGADIVNTDINVHEVDDSEVKLSANFSSMTSGSSSLPSEIVEHTLPMDQEDLKEKENNNEEVDEIKEIDERILSELDTVGDFNVGEIGLPERSHVAHTESAMLADDMETETSVGLPVLEARSVEDIDLAFKQLHEGADFEEVILPSMVKNQPDHADTNSDLPVVEARSLEDIHNALLQDPEPNLAQLPHSTDLRNGSSAVEQHHVVSSEEIEVSNAAVCILPSMIENLPDHTDTTSEFPVVEARSLDGIHNAFIKGPEPNPAELPHSADLRHGSSEVEQHDVVSSNEIEVGQAVSGFEEHLENAAAGEPKKEYEELEELKMETNAELPVLDARSVEDIDLAYKQLDEGVDVEEIVLASMIEDQLDHEDSTSKLPVVEARSLEDIHNAFQKGPEPNLAELPLSTDLRNGSSEIEQHDVVSNKEIEVGHAVSGIQQNSQNAAGEPKNDHEETEEMKMETNAELPVLEARSLEDIDFAFKQLHEGVDVEEVILPSMIENQQGDADTNLDLPVVEARSLEDIQSAFQQGPESNLAEVPHSSGIEHHDVVSTEEIDGSSPVSGIQAMSENAAGGPKNEYKEMVEKEMETEVVLPVLEAKSVEDIDVTFKQLHEG
ncbi:microtubule-associated protein futsch-like [Gossypium australe]|uniref:Microtubule-associated protein futsch-like n=1 Tax=Gossypium australe TaxID=47621 RepID=A0A5B6W9R2_9ROSI|nr:microtubule-associated protein futsch-like [Gossypium australe]